MKKIICILMTLVMTLALCVPVTAADSEPQVYTPTETFTREELLAMDPELDSDGDGLADVYEIIFETNRFNPDTDYDGVNDYVELCVTCTDVLVPDGELDTDGDGLTNAQEGVYGTNADDKDSDNDNLSDYDEIVVHKTDPLSKNTNCNSTIPNQSVVSGGTSVSPLAYTGPDISITNPDISTSYNTTLVTGNGTSSVTYSFSCSRFLGDNTEYDTNIATLSSLLSAIAYDGSYLSNTYTGDNGHPLFDWFHHHAFNGFDSYDLSEFYSDQHVSEMFVGHRTFSTGSGSANLICVVIRGTNGTLKEWQSNFDVGDTADQPTTSGWVIAKNHMGFDITARRLNAKLSEYITNNNLSGGNNIFWITGHSRGGALANIMSGIRSNAGSKVFGYTFAAPATTTAPTAQTGANFACIFNIINEDDFVPQLPLTSWEFKRYGKDVSASIENKYASEWDSLTGKTYAHSEENQKKALTEMSTIAANREACYEYPSGTVAYRVYSDEYFLSENLAESAAAIFTGQYPDVADGTYRSITAGSLTSYTYYVEYQPLCLMMLMAEVMANPTLIDELSFATCDLPQYLGSARNAVVTYALSKQLNAIKHPHLVESYYLLASNIATEEE